jgi:hypothetical protein
MIFDLGLLGDGAAGRSVSHGLGFRLPLSLAVLSLMSLHGWTRAQKRARERDMAVVSRPDRKQSREG